jgi:hypothetical protein
MILEYRQFCTIPQELRQYSVPKDYGICTDTGRPLVVYKIDTRWLPKELKEKYDEQD